MTFVIFFGRLPVFRHTPIAWIHRLFLVHLPRGVLALDQRLTAGKFTTLLRRFGHFMMNDRHPTILIFFIALLAVSEYYALPAAWPLLATSQKATVAVLVVLPYLFLYLAAAADPGTVSLATLPQQLLQYPYDYALFHPGARCRTCNLLKPPRSKHCPVCKRCIARLDHHCVFINNCVGAGNTHWFLLLLFSTAVLVTYGGVVGARLVAQRITTERYPGWSLLPWRSSLSLSPSSPSSSLTREWLIPLAWGLRRCLHLGTVSLLALLLSPLVWGLLVYNLWNVWTGQTTNESLKWADWQCDVAEGLAYRRPFGSNFDAKHASHGAYHRRSSTDTGAWTRWPVEAAHVLVRSEDGLPPPPDDPTLPGVGAWEQVQSLRDVDNLYDLGFWRNLTDIFVPSYSFRAAGLPSVEARGRPRARTRRK
ncbi:palmitoyltransferase swf1 [Niveomyces insectorum RCEF 264]|uniref:Palmitoyltransferase n=1 Tax=Niveomyces insectorum RCEF 264 TaxID=1081102 RepID=A0A167SS44_9HYPO|nr:palmitoyltransferase swf1 [Niveomyces insectorum RCEF 264]